MATCTSIDLNPLAVNRTDEIIASGADTVATACPFCTIMLRDGVQDRNAGDKVQVMNVSELVAKSMKRKREIDDANAPLSG